MNNVYNANEIIYKNTPRSEDETEKKERKEDGEMYGIYLSRLHREGTRGQWEAAKEEREGEEEARKQRRQRWQKDEERVAAAQKKR